MSKYWLRTQKELSAEKIKSTQYLIELKADLELLKQIEWSRGTGINPVCPFCLGEFKYGHLTGCIISQRIVSLEKLIKKVESE